MKTVSDIVFKDFSTRSLEMGEGKTSDNLEKDVEKDSSKAENEPSSSEMDDDIKQFQMRRKWETRWIFL